VGVDVRRHQTIDWPGKRAVQAVDEQGFKDCALEDHISFAAERVECSGPGCVRDRSLWVSEWLLLLADSWSYFLWLRVRQFAPLLQTALCLTELGVQVSWSRALAGYSVPVGC